MIQTRIVAVLLALGCLVGGRTAVGATGVPSTASNLGVCSSYLGQLQVRDDVNHAIQENGQAYGLDSPGELYRVRAHQHVNGTPEQECVQR